VLVNQQFRPSISKWYRRSHIDAVSDGLHRPPGRSDKGVKIISHTGRILSCEHYEKYCGESTPVVGWLLAQCWLLSCWRPVKRWSSLDRWRLLHHWKPCTSLSAPKYRE